MFSNGLGSTSVLPDGAGNVVDTYEYDVFGALRSGYGGSTGYRFTGQQTDLTFGYTYLRARYYDAETGRFISKDPFPGSLNDPAGLHRYVYVESSPTNWIDPRGLDPLQLRTPDYYPITLNVAIPNPVTLTFVGATGQVVVDRYGHVYVGGGNVGRSVTAFSFSATGGYVLQDSQPSEEQLQQFISGLSINLSAGFWLGGGVTWGNVGHCELSDFAGEIGFVTPQAGVTGTYLWMIR